ncbi:AraC family transcriptional regulator [Vibrio navarrensis]
MCGYLSTERFTQRFRQRFGLTPREYLKTLPS